MKRKAQTGMRATTAPQALESLKTQLQNLTNVNVQDLPNQVQNLTNLVEQIETQVGQLEQMRQQMQQATQQNDDGVEQQSMAAKRKKDKERHPGPRDSEETKGLPDFWRKNKDYGESPYMHIDKLEKITDEVPLSKREKGKKDKNGKG